MSLLVSVPRKALKDITLVDGTFIPKGTMVCAASYPTHRDDAHYTAADEFDPFRFSRMREKEGEGMKHQFVNTSVDYMPFGHGKHAWWVRSRVEGVRLLTSRALLLQPWQIFRCERAQSAIGVPGCQLRLQVRGRWFSSGEYLHF